MKIGIIGLGFVGGAVQNAHQIHNVDIVLHDPFKGITADEKDLHSCDGIFICVPSPSFKDGSCDTSILESVLESLKDYDGVLISKVTCPPTVYSKLQKLYPNLVHAPEFLVAATAKEDYLAGEFSIIGGNVEQCEKAFEIIEKSQTKINKKLFCKIEEAAMIKYTINSFLATKVVFMNQIKDICDLIDADFSNVINGVKFDNRLGKSHFDAPGPDGKYGFGGACFPKDTKALSYMSASLGESFTLLDKAIEINNQIRN
jgi:UDPglucose 6-dehydrogenase